MLKLLLNKKILPIINHNEFIISMHRLKKSNISRLCLINFLNRVSSNALHAYLGLAEVYDGNANKKKSDLIEMIVYGCMNGKLKNKVVDEISVKRVHTILRENNINFKSLPGYGNMGLRKKDIKPYVENESNEKSSVNIPLQ